VTEDQPLAGSRSADHPGGYPGFEQTAASTVCPPFVTATGALPSCCWHGIVLIVAAGEMVPDHPCSGSL
jgi:hypothetical protein